MKKYQVYGIGNALVDMEIEVNEDFLKKSKVDKGLMTLVDEARQKELLVKLDGVQHKRSCGGSAANTIIAVSQLNGRGFYSCKVASDEPGDFYYQDLLESGVQTNLSNERASGVTGKCMVFVTPDADRTMNTYLGITETLSINEIDEKALKESEFLYIEGYLVTSDSGRAAAIKARELAESYGVKTALTFSDPGVVGYFKSGFLDILGAKGVDVLFCNESEALSFSGESTVEAAAVKLKKIAKTFAITMGAEGAYIFDGEKAIYIILGQETTPIDTNGAGDLFAGAFLYALSEGHSYAKSGKLACQLATKLVTQFGARLKKAQALEIKSKVLGL